MKKQKFPLSLNFLLLLTVFFIGSMPMKVYAGLNVVKGTSEESSTFSGDTFSLPNRGTPLRPAPGTNATVEINGRVRIPGVVQERVNHAASQIINQSGGCGELVVTDYCTVVVILVRGSAATVALNKLQASLSSSGVPQYLIVELVNQLVGLFKGFSLATTPSVPVAELKLRQLVASTKLVQRDEKSNNVDINQLDAAIKAYDNIILKSDRATLQKLSKNQEFLKIGQILKELRSAVKVG